MQREIEPQRKLDGKWVPTSEFERAMAESRQKNDPKVILDSGDYDRVRAYLADYHEEALDEVYDDLKKPTLVEGLEMVVDALAEDG